MMMIWWWWWWWWCWSLFTGRQYRPSLLCRTLYLRSGCPSVRPSATRHWVKTTQARITKSSPTEPKVSSFRDKKSSRNWRPSLRALRALKESGVGKIRNFQPISRRISETVQDRTKVTFNVYSNGKSQRPFDWCRNQRPWMTLNGQYALCCRKGASFGAHHRNLNEETHTISGKNVGQWLEFLRYKVDLAIRGGSLGRGHQTTVGLSRTAIISVFLGFPGKKMLNDSGVARINAGLEHLQQSVFQGL